MDTFCFLSRVYIRQHECTIFLPYTFKFVVGPLCFLTKLIEETRLKPLRWKNLETFCGFRGQQRKQMSGFLIKLLDTVKPRKLLYCGHTMKKQGSCLEKEVMQGKMPGARRRGRPRTAWVDNIKTWTGFSVEESVRMTKDRDKWRKYMYVRGVANPWIEGG